MVGVSIYRLPMINFHVIYVMKTTKQQSGTSVSVSLQLERTNEHFKKIKFEHVNFKLCFVSSFVESAESVGSVETKFHRILIFIASVCLSAQGKRYDFLLIEIETIVGAKGLHCKIQSTSYLWVVQQICRIFNNRFNFPFLLLNTTHCCLCCAFSHHNYDVRLHQINCRETFSHNDTCCEMI